MEAIRLADYRSVVFFTGAGMSAESGVPVYRVRGGIWHQYNYEDYACQRAFDRDPQKVLDFHEVRRTRVLACQPHAGHRHIAKLQEEHPAVHVITQNIDGNPEPFEIAERLIRDCDLFVAVGTSAVVYPAAALPQIARRAGATMIEINPEETELSALYDQQVREPASIAIPRLLDPRYKPGTTVSPATTAPPSSSFQS